MTIQSLTIKHEGDKFQFKTYKGVDRDFRSLFDYIHFEEHNLEDRSLYWFSKAGWGGCGGYEHVKYAGTVTHKNRFIATKFIFDPVEDIISVIDGKPYNRDKDMFIQAGLSEDFYKNHRHQLGGSVTRPGFRQKGISSKLSELLFELPLDSGMFLYTTTENEPVHRMAKRFGFEQAGNWWRNKDWKGDDFGPTWVLFTRGRK